MRIRATEAFEVKPVEMKVGYWIRSGLGMWVMIEGPAKLCLRDWAGNLGCGMIVERNWKVTNCTEYSPDCGATWLPIARTVRGMLPGDVLIEADTDEPVAWCSKSNDSLYIMRTDNTGSFCSAGAAKEHTAGLVIVYGEEATPILVDIIKGKYATEA